ncbi:MAG: hypothetical protein OXF93_03350 [Acidobacteria bacterium]|nr:hypothetical protein [Acidobacteriota bacterium]
MCAASGGAAAQPRLPALTVEAPERLRAVAVQLSRLDTGRLAAVMRLVGLDEPGNRIRVALVPEETRVARDAPPWVAAFADPDNDLIVLFPGRIGSYPHDTLELVLHHEVAHILAARAAGGGRLPRWFNEGVASVAERSWGIGNRSRFLWATLVAGQPTVTALEGLFYEGERDAARAYVISHALVRDLLRRHGAGVVSRILAGVADGVPFDYAFADATGTTVRGAARIFWRTSGGWEEWITFVASPFTLWTMIATLSLAAIWRHRRRRAERRRLWEAEERFEADRLDVPPRDYRVH